MMASYSQPTTTDWAPANPWTWMLTGLAAATAAQLWARLLGETGAPFRILLIAVALLTAGTALWIRLSAPRRFFLDHRSRGLQELALTLPLWLGIILVVVRPLAPGSEVEQGGDWGVGVFYAALLVLSVGIPFVRRWRSKRSADEREEKSALVLLAALVSWMASFALYLGKDPAREGDTIQLFLAVMALIAFAGAVLVLFSRGIQRLLVSVVVVLHFGGIFTAVMAAPPAPWLALRLSIQFYRPYLEFFYLGNAYHFYAPDPGPCTLGIFRIASKDARGQERWQWIKLPDIDDDGRPRYPVSLAYQRALSLTDQLTRPEILPNGPIKNAIYMRRVEAAQSGELPPNLLGAQQPAGTSIMFARHQLPISGALTSTPIAPLNALLLVCNAPQHSLGPNFKGPAIPLYIDSYGMNLDLQYARPSLHSKRMLSSYVRHLAHKFLKENPGSTILEIKAYKVTHKILNPKQVIDGIDPCAPTEFEPYFMGAFNAAGQLLDEQDPYLYWLIPIYQEQVVTEKGPQVRIYNWLLLHGGDRNWIMHPGKNVWSPN
jgi:hypothetical protein